MGVLGDLKKKYDKRLERKKERLKKNRKDKAPNLGGPLQSVRDRQKKLNKMLDEINKM